VERKDPEARRESTPRMVRGLETLLCRRRRLRLGEMRDSIFGTGENEPKRFRECHGEIRLCEGSDSQGVQSLRLHGVGVPYCHDSVYERISARRSETF